MRTLAIIDIEGDLHLDATLTQNAWSHHNDAELLHGLRASLFPERHELRQRFGQFIQSAKPVLERTGVVTYNDHEGGDGSIFISVKGLHMLTIDAVRQLYERMKRYEAVLVELGADPKQLEMEYPL